MNTNNITKKFITFNNYFKKNKIIRIKYNFEKSGFILAIHFNAIRFNTIHNYSYINIYNTYRFVTRILMFLTTTLIYNV